MKDKRTTLSRLFEIAGESNWKLALSVISMALGTLAGMTPYLSVSMIARELLLVEGNGTREAIVFWSMMAAVSIVANAVLSFFGSYGAHKIAFRVLYGIRVRVMDHIGHLPMGFFSDHSTRLSNYSVSGGKCPRQRLGHISRSPVARQPPLRGRIPQEPAP
ncbi:MAG: hypothetical protein LBD93_05910, partial [Treponema sp.]|nr:hypothetical protein [Treponema sp.]